GDVCDPDETCTGTSATCPSDVVRSSAFVCRAAAGECDVAETCPGVAGQPCPSDQKKTSGTACTADTNPCTLDECDGTHDTCQHPAGNAGAHCRAGSGDVCDPDQFCTGLSTTCPAPMTEPITLMCRPSAGECDPAEFCPGVAGAPCPPDAKAPAATACADDGNP